MKDFNNKDFSKDINNSTYSKHINEYAKEIIKQFRAGDSYKEFYHSGTRGQFIYCKEGYYDNEPMINWNEICGSLKNKAENKK